VPPLLRRVCRLDRLPRQHRHGSGRHRTRSAGWSRCGARTAPPTPCLTARARRCP